MHPAMSPNHPSHPVFRPLPAAALALLLLLAPAAPAAIIIQKFTTGFANDGVVPDIDPSGWQNTQMLDAGAGLQVDHVTVTLGLSGGWNGDLYLTLRHETAGGVGFAVLLNRAGTAGGTGLGYGNPGFGPDASGTAFRLSDSGAWDVHYYQDHAPAYNASGQLTGAWKPDGDSFASFQGLDAGGAWTLFAADRNGGDVTTVVSWGLEITTVPEPGQWLAIPFLLLGTALARRIRSRRACPGKSGI